MSQINPHKKGCPKCGGHRGYLVNVRLFGEAVHRGDWETQDEEIVSQSDQRVVADKSVRCLECGRSTFVKTLRER